MTRTRSGWIELDDRIQGGDELAVWRIDRIGRSMIDVITTVSDLTDRGIAVFSLTDGIDPSTREGRLMLNLMATFAEYERRILGHIHAPTRARIRDIVRGARRCGHPDPPGLHGAHPVYEHPRHDRPFSMNRPYVRARNTFRRHALQSPTPHSGNCAIALGEQPDFGGIIGDRGRIETPTLARV